VFVSIRKLKYLTFLLSCVIVAGCFSGPTYYRPPLENQMPQSRGEGLPPNAEPGKCYAQYFERSQIIDTFKFFEYVGDDFEQDGIELKEVKVKPGSTKWETKIDPNCKSNNPDNCKMKCLVEIPAEYKEIYIVTDTASIKTYKTNIVEQRRSGKASSEWLEVICQTQMTQQFYKKLEHKLLENNYLDYSTLSNSRGEIKEAFTNYQKDNNLPSGNFFVVALKHIGL